MKLKISMRLIVLWLLIGYAASANSQSYVIGVVPQFDARRIQKIWQPILKVVTERTGMTLDLKGSPSIPAFEDAFTAGEFDFAYMNPYHLIVANKHQGYLPLVREIGSSLYGIIVVRKDSPFQEIQELDGKTVAFPAPNALGAALIPRAEFSRTFAMQIIPRYVKSHTSVYLNVVLRQADAGGGVQKTLEQQKPEIQDALRILYKTPEVAPHPFAAHPRVPKGDREAVASALLALGATQAGQALLMAIPIQQIGVATLDDYEPLRAMELEKFYVKE